MVKKLSNEEFINKAKLIHKNIYDYSKVNYINNRTKIIIILYMNFMVIIGMETPKNFYQQK